MTSQQNCEAVLTRTALGHATDAFRISNVNRQDDLMTIRAPIGNLATGCCSGLAIWVHSVSWSTGILEDEKNAFVCVS
jgi:hypothetical protein